MDYLSDVSLTTRRRSLLSLSAIFFILSSTASAILIFDGYLLEINRFAVYLVGWIYVLSVFLFFVFFARRLILTRRLALLMFIFGHLVWFAFPLYQALIGQIYWFGNRTYFLPVTDQNVLSAIVYIATFLTLVLAVYSFITRIRRAREGTMPTTSPKARQFDCPRVLLIIIGLCIVGMIPFLVYGGGMIEIITNILQSRGETKGWDQRAFESKPLRVLGLTAMVSAAALALSGIFSAKKLPHRICFSLLFVICFAITYFDTGTRTWTLLMVGPYLLLWLARLDGRRLFPVRKILYLSVLTIAMSTALEYQASQRYTGFFSQEKHTPKASTGWRSDDNNYLLEMAITLSAFPRHFDYVHQPSVWLFLTNPIPRAVWEGKPYPKIIREYSYARDGSDIYFERGVSRMPSVVGQYYIMGGTAGVVLISLLFGGLLSWIDWHWRQPGSDVFHVWLGVLTVWMLISFRGIFPGFHYPVLIVGMVAFLVRERRRSVRFG